MFEAELDEIDLYIEELDSREPATRVAAIQVLGETVDDRAFQALAALLRDRKRDIVRAAIKALAAGHGPRAVPQLLPLLAHSDTQVRIEAQFALVRIGTPAVAALIEALRDEEINTWAATTLGLIGDRRAASSLVDLLTHSQATVRSNACQALEKLREPSTLEALIAALEDPDMLVRRSAASALGELGKPEALEPLVRRLRDDEWEVRVNAARALGRLGDPRAIPPLRETLRYEGPLNGPFDDVRKAAEQAIEVCAQ